MRLASFASSHASSYTAAAPAQTSYAKAAPVQKSYVATTSAHVDHLASTPSLDHSSFGGLPKLGPSSEETYEANVNNTTLEQITWNSDDGFDFRDVVHGNGGYDYISTGGGADLITVGNNDGTWRGTGNEFMNNATIVDGGSGNDDIIVDATKGAFHITTGEGQDDVVVKGGDYVKIDAYDSVVELGDTFTFAATFGGKAELYGVDSMNGSPGCAYTDHISLEGGVWHEMVNGNNGSLAFYNDATGGMVTVWGSQTADLGTHPTWDL